MMVGLPFFISAIRLETCRSQSRRVYPLCVTSIRYCPSSLELWFASPRPNHVAINPVRITLLPHTFKTVLALPPSNRVRSLKFRLVGKKPAKSHRIRQFHLVEPSICDLENLDISHRET